MNKKELKNILDKEGINPSAYCLDGGLPNEQYVLSDDNERWSVYYSERGIRSNMNNFSSEGEACNYILHLLLEDPTTR